MPLRPTSKQFFGADAPRLARKVLKSVQRNQSLHGALPDCDDCVYVKSAEGVLIATNPTYDAVFAKGESPLGRHGRDCLSQSIIPVSQQSDALILSGCEFMQCVHRGHDAHGRELSLFTHKQSLLGLGLPNMAILGITRIEEVLSEFSTSQRKSLNSLWHVFNQFSDSDKAIAVRLAQGQSAAEVAEALDVSKRTVEKRRGTMLQELGFASQVELVKLIVRLHDNGYGDFGM